MGNNTPLVTVGVVTYNSSKYILDTLNSIKLQTYQNIELIVSDDASKDNTVEYCRTWFAKNSDRFVRTELITVVKNTGTSGNANRILKKSEGQWIKFLAGDDLLTHSAIEDYINFVKSNSEIQATFAESTSFHDIKYIDLTHHEKIDLELLAFNNRITAKSQFKILKYQLIGFGPSFFINRKVLELVNGFDERYPLIDDYPLFIKITKAGFKLFLFHKITTLYRMHSNSVSHNSTNGAIYTNAIIICNKVYRYKYKEDNLNWVWRQLLYFSIYLHNKVIDAGNNKNILKCRILYVIQRLIDPFDWYSRYLNCVDKLLRLYYSDK